MVLWLVMKQARPSVRARTTVQWKFWIQFTDLLKFLLFKFNFVRLKYKQNVTYHFQQHFLLLQKLSYPTSTKSRQIRARRRPEAKNGPKEKEKHLDASCCSTCHKTLARTEQHLGIHTLQSKLLKIGWKERPTKLSLPCWRSRPTSPELYSERCWCERSLPKLIRLRNVILLYCSTIFGDALETLCHACFTSLVNLGTCHNILQEEIFLHD